VVPPHHAETVDRFLVTDTAVRCLSARGKEKEEEQFLKELETLHHHAQTLGEALGMTKIVSGMSTSDSQTVAFQFQEKAVDRADVVGLMADGRLSCTEVRQHLDRDQT